MSNRRSFLNKLLDKLATKLGYVSKARYDVTRKNRDYWKKRAIVLVDNPDGCEAELVRISIKNQLMVEKALWMGDCTKPATEGLGYISNLNQSRRPNTTYTM